MDIILYDIHTELCRQWGARFFDNPKVKIMNSGYNQMNAKHQPRCVVSPANSFGIMDGGLDGVLREYIPGVQQKVTEMIDKTWGGFLPPNDCALVKTGYESAIQPRWLAVVPTMPWPMPVADIMTPYYAMRGLLAELHRYSMQKRGESIYSVAIPGLGTGTGRVPTNVAAELMYLAYKHFHQNPTPATWSDARIMMEEIESAVQHG